MKKRYILQLLVSFILIYIALRVFLKKEEIELLKSVTVLNLLVSIILAFIIYFISGVRYLFLLWRWHKVRLHLIDIAFVPITMNLWSMIIPFQGALLYSTIFFKKKYNIAIRDSLTINLCIYFFSIILAGIMGIYFSVVSHKIFSLISFVSIMLIFSPAEVFLLNRVLRMIKGREKSLFSKIHLFLSNIISSLASNIKDINIIVTFLFINVVHIVISIVWYYYAFRVFGFEIPLLLVIAFTLFVKISLILYLVPGNLGVEEFVSIGIFALLGGAPSQALLVTLFIRMSTLFLMIPIGVISTINNMRYVRKHAI